MRVSSLSSKHYTMDITHHLGEPMEMSTYEMEKDATTTPIPNKDLIFKKCKRSMKKKKKRRFGHDKPLHPIEHIFVLIVEPIRMPDYYHRYEELVLSLFKSPHLEQQPLLALMWPKKLSTIPQVQQTSLYILTSWAIITKDLLAKKKNNNDTTKLKFVDRLH